MCIVIYKPKGTTVDKATLKECWDRNSDGAGFMFNANGEVHGNKGYMTFKSLLAGLEDAGFYKETQLVKGKEVIIHFRLASHGGVSQANTHPFPISDSLEDLQALFWSASVGMAHNGVISINIPRKDISDTMTYVMQLLSDPNVQNHLDSPGVYRLVAATTSGSRLIFLRADGLVIRTGDWVSENGVFYSNEGFRIISRKPKSITTAVYRSYQRGNQQELIEDLDWQEKAFGRKYPA